MSDEIVEQSTRGWGSRLLESIKGVLLGLVLFIGAFPLLGWNEGRAVKTARSLEEGASAVVAVSADSVDAANDGTLVHLIGTATTDDVLSDPVFDVSETALQLIRDVETYQWKETRETETRKKMGGGEERVTTYRYTKEWSSRRIDSSGFKEPSGHQNPGAMRFESRAQLARQVTLGAFRLPESLVRQLSRTEALPILTVPESHAGDAIAQDGRLYFGADPTSPAVGDTRVRFRVARPAEVSVVAEQSGETLVPYPTKAGRPIELLSYGAVPAEQMFTAEMRKNTALTWALRAVGFIVMTLGLTLIFKPLVVVADVVPLIGNLLEMGLGAASFLLSGALSLITVAIAWIAFRPLVGVPLLLAGIALLVVPKVMRARSGGARAGG